MDSSWFTNLVKSCILLLLIAVSGCATAGSIPSDDKPIVSATFGDDYRGVEGASATLSGKYRLELVCSGSGDLQVSIEVDGKIVNEFVIQCQQKITQPLEITPSVSGTVELAVVSSSMEGTVSLYKD